MNSYLVNSNEYMNVYDKYNLINVFNNVYWEYNILSKYTIDEIYYNIGFNNYYNI
jgi:hypothetical protein